MVEASHDERGIIWPKSAAPYHIHLISIAGKSGKNVSVEADKIARELEARGAEVLWDDRDDASAGEKFADADLIGLPLRLVVSAKTLEKNSAELKRRDSDEVLLVPIAEIVERCLDFLSS